MRGIHDTKQSPILNHLVAFKMIPSRGVHKKETTHVGWFILKW